jgi:phosphoglycolate phosphatase
MHNLPADKSPSLAGWTIVFDLDGTLVESAPDIVGALNTLLDEENLSPTPMADGRLMIGQGARRLVERGFASAGRPLDAAQSDAMLARFLPLYMGRIAHESTPYDGCLDALDLLAARGATLAVCTNKRIDQSLALLDALAMTDRFAAIVGGDQPPAPKPDPGHILMTIEKAGGDPARAVMVGDTSADTLAAEAAGIPCIVVDFGYSQTPPAELGGAALISHFRDLVAAIDALPSCPNQTGSL